MKRPSIHLPNRRTFLKQASVVVASAASGRLSVKRALALGRDKSTGDTGFSAVENRAPLAPQAFYLLPLGAVRPAGWLTAQLRIQADGLSGHLDEIWPDVGPNSGWLGGTGESWERGPYYLDGLVPLAYLLNDATLKAKAQRYIDWTLSSQKADGSFGPRDKGHSGTRPTADWWPRMVMLKVLTQYQEVSGDPRVIPFMTRYFAYQLAALPASPLMDWGKYRWQDNVMTVLWLYNRTSDPKLLDLARLLHQQGHDWQAQFADFTTTEPLTRAIFNANGGGLGDLALSTHGVNVGQSIKASPIRYMLSGKAEDRAALERQLREIDRYHGLPNGIFSCDEHLAGRNPSQGSELCTVVETMFSLEQSLAIVGDATLGDRLEKIAFNALPGTLTDDMWAHQYNQEANQVECGHIKPWYTDGPESNLFGLEPNFGCCTANYHQGWPKFASSLWMASPDGGLAVAAYAPCRVETTVGKVPVHLRVDTEYPFRETVKIFVDPRKPTTMPISLRIPEWAKGAEISINGKLQQSPSTGSYARLERLWIPGDLIELRLPMKPAATRWFQDSVSVSRGPLVFSYPIGTKWEKLREHGPTADWEIHATSAWNYGLDIDPAKLDQIQVRETSLGDRPFSQEGTPVTLVLTARKVPAWTAANGVAGILPQSPVTTDAPMENITLIPYAAAKLRITAFPLATTSGAEKII